MPFSVSLWNDLVEPFYDGVGLKGLTVRPMHFYWPKLLAAFLTSIVFPFSSLFLCADIVWLGPFLIECKSLTASHAIPTYFNNINNNNYYYYFSLMSVRLSVRSAKCLFDQVPVRPSARSAKCPFGQVPVWPNILRPSVSSATCPSADPLLFLNHSFEL